ncbi:MAG: YdcF family protein [Anaerolineaceae bacterium]|nr:YdcF family protein [Anaerolineaceae bacterium]
MSIHFIFMILGDLLVIIMMGFYAGVGIWESGTIRHIFGMLFPSAAVWLAAALLFRLYADLPKQLGETTVKELPSFLDKLKKLQKPGTLFTVWLITCIFQTFWLSFYWRGILHSQSYFYRFSLGTALWYFSSYALFFVFWRFLWTNCAALISAARTTSWIRITMIVLLSAAVLYAAAIAAVCIRYQGRKYTVDTLPENAPRTALVFGAGVYLNGEPSAVMTDRVRTAVELYERGLIDEMIMSGDNSDGSRNEVDHMAALAVESGVPESAVIRDDHGIHTAESLYNAKNVFGKDALIYVSQDFHNVRILMTGDKYGIDGIAVAADRRIYNISSWMLWYILDWLRLPIYYLHY